MQNRLLILIAAFLLQDATAADWEHYAGDAGGKRYSALRQINPENVNDLAIAWQFRSGELGVGYKSAEKLTFEATPVLWNNTLYISTAFNKVIALDAASQPVLFNFDQNGKPVPAVVQATRSGMLFVFNRLTGQPLFTIDERAVPQEGVAGDALSPTQPFSALPSLVQQFQACSG